MGNEWKGKFLEMMAAMPPCKWWDLWRAVVEHESHGDWTAWKKDEDARGPAQIRAGNLADVVQSTGMEIEHDECFNPFVAYLDFRAYLERWRRHYLKTERKEPDDEALARMWNGGPDGYRKESTLKYWADVKQILARIAQKKVAGSAS